MSNNKFIQLKNPPIKEAVFGILYSLEDDFDVTNFESFIKKVNSEFTIKNHIDKVETKIQGGNSNASTKTEKEGYLLLNEDKTKAIQLRKSGFMYSINQNSYTNWENFKKEAWGYFEEFINRYNIDSINKVSLRYINSIDLPTAISDIKEYITISPNLPKELDYGINRMFLQMVLPNNNIDAVGIVNQNFNIGKEIGEYFSYILDIDVSITKSRSIKELKEVKVDFDNLRDFKNEIFFESITDKTKKLLENEIS